MRKERVMEQPYYKTIRSLSPMGTLIKFITTPGGRHPLHWHEELEILYPLNGEIDLRIEGKLHLLNKKKPGSDRILPGTQHLCP